MDIPISAYNAYLHMIEVHPPTLQGEEKRFKHKRKHDFITPSEDDESKLIIKLIDKQKILKNRNCYQGIKPTHEN